MPALNEAYITGLLIDYENRIADLTQELEHAQEPLPHK